MTTKTIFPQNPPRWDLSNVYPSLDSTAFQSDVASLQVKASQFEDILNQNGVQKTDPAAIKSTAAELAALLNQILDLANDIMKQSGTMGAYLSSFITTDSYNTAARKKMSELEQVFVRIQQLSTRFQGWVGSIGARLPEILKYPGSIQDHAFFLNEIAEQSKYMMSQAEEALAAELRVSGASAWARLQGTVTSQIKVPFEQDGKTQTLPISVILNMRSDPNEDIRRRAYEAELVIWESVKEPLAAALNGVKGAVNTLDKHRGRSDALHSSIDDSRIDRATLEAMLSAMRNSFPMFRKYFDAKARRLGKEKLAWWDLFAPAGESKKRYSFAQACELIVANFNKFSPELGDFARHAFLHNWIDAEMRDGKRSGAFCMSLPAVGESRILSNFDGSLDSVFTLAHELGHGFHNHCQKEKTELQTVTPMTLAETASIMCETIVTNAALEQAASSAEELAILETSLISDSQVIVDIFSRYLFEKEVFERRAQSELSAEDFCEIMRRSQRETYGDSLDERYLHPYMWTWKSHYYRPGLSFYNYPYAFGLLFGLGLYAIYQERGAGFVEDYKNLLASTGEGTAADLAARFGIDIRSQAFWENSLKMIGARVERYIRL